MKLSDYNEFDILDTCGSNNQSIRRLTNQEIQSPNDVSNESQISEESEEDFFNEESFNHDYLNTQLSTSHIERKHNSEGYLSGITVSKEEYLQKGFDYGYMHGAHMGILVGKILGVMQTEFFFSNYKQTKCEYGLLEINHNIKKFNALTPGELFSKDYYEKDPLKLPGTFFEENESLSQINQLGLAYQSMDKQIIESFLSAPFPGKPELHPSVKFYVEALKLNLKIDITE